MVGDTLVEVLMAKPVTLMFEISPTETVLMPEQVLLNVFYRLTEVIIECFASIIFLKIYIRN